MNQLALMSLNDNTIKNIKSFPGLSESTVLNVLEKIKKQAAQFEDIRKFYDDFQEFKQRGASINKLLDRIKSDSGKNNDFQNLNRSVAKYTYSFF